MVRIVEGAELTPPGSGRRLRIERFIGEGSQGSVHEAVDVTTGDRLALKWYFPATATTAQRRAITELIDRGAPTRVFLWPQQLLSADDGTFGYLMDLRPERYAGLADLLTGKVDVPFSIVCTLGLDLAASFLALHSEGLCYRDISFGNVFFDSETGKPLICDNDNVGIDGESPSAVLGTRRFMAPEIVRREAGPSTQTDLYSLSVLLFYLLMVGHPLVGKRELDFRTWDDEAESVLFGHDPVFVFDPADDRNAPDAEMHACVLINWNLYPSLIRDLFVRAFTEGIRDPESGRIRESVWRRAFAELRDLIVRCPRCGKENYWLSEGENLCWFCERPIEPPVRLEIGGRVLVLNDDTKVCRHHTRTDYDFTTVLASVTRHPTQRNRWGLRNDSDSTWRVRTPAGDEIEAGPGQTVGLLRGSEVRMDGVVTRIER